jgi:spermidine/putrescine transport system substrate-binding protein
MKFLKWVIETPLVMISFLLILVITTLLVVFPDKIERVVLYTQGINPDELYEDTLRVYTFTEYFENATIVEKFEKSQKVKVLFDYYSSNEELHEALNAGKSYDLVVPTDYMVTRLVNEGHIIQIDRNLLSNYALIDARFTEMDYDYGNFYSIPYFWGAVGLVYDTKFVFNPPLSWSAVFDSAEIVRMRYNLSLLNDPRMSIGLSLISLGYSPNTTNQEEISAATDRLLQLVPYLTGIHNDNLGSELQNESLNLAVNWSGNSALISNQDSDIRFSLPSEGSIFFVDNLCIPSTSTKQELAHSFIDFLLDPHNSASLTNSNFYPNPITESRRYVDRIILKGPSYINPFLSSNIYYIRSLDSVDTIYEQQWEKVLEEFERYTTEKDGKKRSNNRIMLH